MLSDIAGRALVLWTLLAMGLTTTFAVDTTLRVDLHLEVHLLGLRQRNVGPVLVVKLRGRHLLSAILLVLAWTVVLVAAVVDHDHSLVTADLRLRVISRISALAGKLVARSISGATRHLSLGRHSNVGRHTVLGRVDSVLWNHEQVAWVV